MKSPIPAALLAAAGFALLSTGCQTTAPTKVAPVFGPTNPQPKAGYQGPQTYGSVIELKPGKEKLYRELHANVWPEVRAAIRKAKIRNYRIYVAELGGKKYLFSQFDYVGTNADADLGAIKNDPTTRDKWWPITDGCQIRLPGTPEGQQWTSLESLMTIP